MFNDANLTPIGLFLLRDFEGLPKDQRAAMLDRAARYFDFAFKIGAGMVMARSNVQPDSASGPQRIVADLHHVPGRQRGFTEALRAAGYDGVFSLECFSDQLRTEPASDVANDGYVALNALWKVTG